MCWSREARVQRILVRACVRAEALEAARHANGTDVDLLLIPIYQPDPQNLGQPGTVQGSTGGESTNSKIHRCLRRLEDEEGATDGVGEFELR